jgi:hypothetical protein
MPRRKLFFCEASGMSRVGAECSGHRSAAAAPVMRSTVNRSGGYSTGSYLIEVLIVVNLLLNPPAMMAYSIEVAPA